VPDAIHLVVVVRFEIGGDAAPVDRFGSENAVRLVFGDVGQEFDGAVVFGPAEAGVRFADVKHVKEVFRRQEIDRTVMDDATTVGDEEGWRPDDIERSNRIPIFKQVEAERHESVRNRGLDTGVWIRHGIQLLAAASRDLHHVDQEWSPSDPRFVERRIPFSSPIEGWGVVDHAEVTFS
jgi:hypothetical protein